MYVYTQYFNAHHRSIQLFINIFRKLRKRDASKFHVQLCLSLLGMLLVFVVGIDRTGVLAGCVTVSVLIHYFTLVAVMWMAAEAVLMFQKLVIVFIQITTRYIIIVSLVCWREYLKDTKNCSFVCYAMSFIHFFFAVAPIVPIVIPLSIDPRFMVSYHTIQSNQPNTSSQEELHLYVNQIYGTSCYD